MKQRTTLTWLLIAFVMVASVALYFAYRNESPSSPQNQESTPSPESSANPTASPGESGFKTYESQGVSFQYPSDAEVVGVTKNESGRTSSTWFYEISITLSNGKPITFSLWTNPQNSPLSEWISDNQPIDSASSEISVDGEQAYLYLENAMGSASPVLFTKHNATVLIIGSLDNSEEFQQIYKSVKFTNE